MIGPFEDFTQRPYWPAILLFVFGYKMGEAMAGVMAMPLYIALGFTLNEIGQTLEGRYEVKLDEVQQFVLELANELAAEKLIAVTNGF